MYKLIITFIFMATAITYSFAEESKKGVICKNNSVTVITKSQQDCKNINGKVHTNFLFVINFDSGSYDGKTLTINGNGQSNVIYFIERPYMEAGHIGVEKFRNLWVNSNDNVSSGFQNATLSLITNSREENNIFTLTKPSIKDNSITFEAKLVEGNLPEEFDTGGLFMESTIPGLCPGCIE
ncbi:MAG: hypothetical protein ACR2NW_07125 [Thermodesulfobacteriota bacterium]